MDGKENSLDKTERTILAYDKNHQAYSEKFMQFAPYMQQIDEFIAFLPAQANILDVGCGPGNVAYQLMKAGKEFRVTGFDLSAEMIKTAATIVPQGRFFVRDIRQTDFPAHEYDAVILSFCIVHLTDDEARRLIVKACNWLKKNGHLYMSFMEGKNPGFETTSFSQEKIFFNYFNRNDIVYQIKQAGVFPIRVQQQDYFEPDGSITADIFIFGKKLGESGEVHLR